MSQTTSAAIRRIIASVGIQERDYQTVACEKTLDHLLGGGISALIESPTGSGKTIMALVVAAHLQRTLGISVGWCAMRRNLLVQVCRENKTRGFGLTLSPISMFDKNPPKVDLLIVDEAHHDATHSMATLHAKIAPKYVLGLTATPYRADRVGLCFQKVIKEAGIFSLVRDGYLARFDHYTLPRYSPEAVASAYLADPGRWGKSVMFFHTEEQCLEAVGRLRAGGVRAELVMASSDKLRQIDDFEEGKVDVLVNMLILTEGFDCPALETVFVRPSNRASSIQMAGRVLRQYEGLQKKIVQCQKTKHPFTRYAPVHGQYLFDGEGWIALHPDDRINAVRDKMMGLIAKAPVDVDTLQAIRKAGEKGRRRRRRGADGLSSEGGFSSDLAMEGV
jgi:superfamily II DNA or RNA helicase